MNEHLKKLAKLAGFLAVTLATITPQASSAHGARWAHQHYQTKRYVEVCKHFYNFTRCKLVPRAALLARDRVHKHTHGFYRHRSPRHGVTVIGPTRQGPVTKTVQSRNCATRPTAVGQAVNSLRRAASPRSDEKRTQVRASKVFPNVITLTKKERIERLVDEGADL
jgi:hypothetical protein